MNTRLPFLANFIVIACAQTIYQVNPLPFVTFSYSIVGVNSAVGETTYEQHNIFTTVDGGTGVVQTGTYTIVEGASVLRQIPPTNGQPYIECAFSQNAGGTCLDYNQTPQPTTFTTQGQTFVMNPSVITTYTGTALAVATVNAGAVATGTASIPSSTVPVNTSLSRDKPNRTAIIVGAVCGSVALLLAVSAGICLLRRRRRQQKSVDLLNDEEPKIDTVYPYPASSNPLALWTRRKMSRFDGKPSVPKSKISRLAPSMTPPYPTKSSPLTSSPFTREDTSSNKRSPRQDRNSLQTQLQQVESELTSIQNRQNHSGGAGSSDDEMRDAVLRLQEQMGRIQDQLSAISSSQTGIDQPPPEYVSVYRGESRRGRR